MNAFTARNPGVNIPRINAPGVISTNTARAASADSIIRLRLKRSAATPANNPSATAGKYDDIATNPVIVSDPESSSASHNSPI